jgi:hypothetical protein
MPVRLTVVTGPIAETHAVIAGLARGHEARLRVELVPWSLEATWSTLAASDMAWIPVSDSAPKAVKSPNRLLESLWAGRLVVADPIPAYLPFADLVPIGTGLEAGVAAALDDPARVAANLAEAQARIAREHSAETCGREWSAVVGAPIAQFDEGR